MTVMRVFAGIVGAALAMAVWSEFVFYNEDPSHRLVAALDGGGADAIRYLAGLGLFYTIPSAFLVGLLGLFGSHGPARIFILGALTGYCIEGAVVPAVYEAPPISFLWTSVAWHGPITVGLGVFLLPRFLSTLTFPRLAVLVVLLGLFWGIWTSWTWEENGSLPIPPMVFLAFCATATVTLLLGYLLLRLANWPDLELTRRASAALIAPALIFFFVQAMNAPLAGVGVFAILAALLSLLLWLGPKPEDAYKYKWQKFPVLLLLPATAVPVYAWVFRAGPPIEPELLVILVAAGGVLVWIGGVVRGVARRSAR
ncbi:MAG: hypothetical protein ACWA5A_01050 [Marinibacterium sp.]